MRRIEVRSQLSFTTAQIEMWFNDHHISSATGFFYKAKEGYLFATNRHNVTGRDNNTDECLDKKNGSVPNKIVIKYHLLRIKREPINETSYRFQIDAGGGHARFEQFFDNGQAWIESLSIGARADLIMMPFKPLDGHDVLAVNDLPGETDIFLYPSDSVSIIGYPFGRVIEENYPVWVNGTIASEPQVDVDQLPLFYIDSRTRHGSSGSPVFAFRPGGLIATGPSEATMLATPVHKFLGIYSGRINQESDIGIVWKRRLLDEIADRATVFEQPHPSGRRGITASIASS